MNRAEFLRISALSLLSLFTPNLFAKKSLHIVDVEIFDEQIIIYFNQDISRDDIKDFEIADKRRNIYKKIFDIKAILDKKAIIYKNGNLKVIKVAQFQKDTSRVVLEDTKEIDIKIGVDENRFTIAFNEVEVVPKDKKIVVIDAGHGGKDSGAVANGKLEKNAVLDISLILKRELLKKGYKVHLTRESDRFIDLRDRTKIANDKKADIFISIHANAMPNSHTKLQGVETYFLSPAKSDKAKNVASFENQNIQDLSYFTKEIFLNVLNHKRIIASNKLAIDTQKHMLSNLGKRYKVVDGGVREAPFWVLVGALMPSILIETGYITNPIERKRLFTKSYQTLLARGVADGVDSYFQKN